MQYRELQQGIMQLRMVVEGYILCSIYCRSGERSAGSHWSLLLHLLQGSGPEDFSHLPPEQRRKKLQAKIDDLNKDIQKEMDQK